jgi:hypothetical protein
VDRHVQKNGQTFQNIVMMWAGFFFLQKCDYLLLVPLLCAERLLLNNHIRPWYTHMAVGSIIRGVGTGETPKIKSRVPGGGGESTFLQFVLTIKIGGIGGPGGGWPHPSLRYDQIWWSIISELVAVHKDMSRISNDVQIQIRGVPTATAECQGQATHKEKKCLQ